ncbi:hypothetical protein BDF19DRAFT_497162 [Syncephalis fuscata]|nr:hypothetical protein BDF19DRAFT_497162 [Syncephalis fuscata]
MPMESSGEESLESSASSSPSSSLPSSSSSSSPPPSSSSAGGPIGLELLQQLIRQMPGKPKPPNLNFTYTGADTTVQELNEFYSYAESRQWHENYQLFARDYKDKERSGESGDEESEDQEDEMRCKNRSTKSRKAAKWNELSDEERIKTIDTMLAALSDSTPGVRMNSARKLVYIAQGAWHECRSSDQQLTALVENNRLLLSRDALQIYIDAFEYARQMLQDAREMPTATATVVIGAERICIEIELYLTLIYMLVESLRTHSTTLIYDAMAKNGPELAAVLVDTVARLMERSVKGFPVKKLLLTLWKVILVTLGDWEIAHEIRDAKRQLYDLPIVTDPYKPKAYPYDLQYFYEELSLKYPVLAQDETMSDRTRYALAMTASSTGPASSLLKPIRDRSERFPMPSSSAHEPNMPLIMPYTSEGLDNDGDPTTLRQSILPEALSEAEKVYKSCLYVPLSALQIAETAAAMDRVERNLPAVVPLSASNSHLNLEDVSKSLPDHLAERERRISTFYRLALTRFEPAIMFFSKVMIATLPNGKNASSKQNSVDNESIRQVNTEELDAARHKEIMWKAVSAILLLMLKLFKASHALQHEHISQLLVEHNFLPLSLKLLGQQDAVALCRAQNEIDSYCFMSHCTRRVKIKPTVSVEPPLPTEASQCRACWRNCFTVMNFLRILQSLAKRRAHRILLMLQYKAPAVLKRVLKVQHSLIQHYAYKVCKTFVPYAGRKWRCTVANMRVITGIYLHCRQDLRDDWLIGGEQELENEEAVNQEHALRTLSSFYNEHTFISSIKTKTKSADTAVDLADIDALIAAFDEELWLEEDDALLLEHPDQLANYEQWLERMLSLDTMPTEPLSALNSVLFPQPPLSKSTDTWPPIDVQDISSIDISERIPTPAPQF